MTDQDKKAFALLMGEMAAAFGKDMQRETMATYFKHLADYKIEAIAYAVEQAIKNSERFPVVKLIREHAATYRPPAGHRQVVSNAPQIAEFTVEQMEESKRQLRELVKGLTDKIGGDNAGRIGTDS